MPHGFGEEIKLLSKLKGCDLWNLSTCLKILEQFQKIQMFKLKPYSVSFLSLGGILLIGMGIYFTFLRPPLLPEDLLYMKTSLLGVQNNIPDLVAWLQKVFWVMGGFIFTTGLLIIYIAQTTFRTRTHGAFIIVLIAGITSIGSMTIVNFILHSDFKFTLLTFTLPWIISLILYRFHR